MSERPDNRENLMSLADQIVWAAQTYGIGGMFEYANLDWDTATDVPVDPIVQNTWYTALATTADVKAYYLIVEQTNNGATVETIECELTVNGVTDTITQVQTNAVLYFIYYDANGVLSAWSPQPRQMLSLDLDHSAPLETRSLGIRVRQTSVVDVVSAIIEVNMVYATLEVT